MAFWRRNAPSQAAVDEMLTALAIADAPPKLRGQSLPEFVESNAIDLVITVGDLHRTDIEGADRLSIPIIGVYGNHCDRRYMEDLGIKNLHLSAATIKGITFTGLEGCVRYKAGSRDALYTQQEYGTLVRGLPPADVIVTHCPPRGINDHPSDVAHVGIEALRARIDTASTRLLIHGHTYPKAPLALHGSTRIEYVYGAKIIRI